MQWETIRKPRGDWTTPPNIPDYAQARTAFSWDAARLALDGLPDGGGLNLAHEAVDRHVAAGRGDKVALRWIAKDGTATALSYRALSLLSNRFANALAGLGLGPGDTVFSLIGRVPELYAAALGTWKQRCVFSPLFSAFGPEPVHARMSIGRGKALIRSIGERSSRSAIACPICSTCCWSATTRPGSCRPTPSI